MHDIVDSVVDIVSEAGGELVGRTKLQKIAYVLESADCGFGFKFTYHHYGPYCEDLSDGVRNAVALNRIVEENRKTSWGGVYSIYKSAPGAKEGLRSRLIAAMKDANSIELELAATALFLFKEGYADPWGKTTELKPEKSTPERLAAAKALAATLEGVADGKLPTVK